MCEFKMANGACADGNCPSGKHSADRTICCADCKETSCAQRCDQSQKKEG